MPLETEDVQKPEDLDTTKPAVEETDDEAELASLAVDDGKGGKMVPLSALVDAKKAARALNKKVKELEPVAARVSEVDGKLEAAMPLIVALKSDKQLLAQALRRAGGQPTDDRRAEEPETDPELAELAETLGLYLTDGQTPDIARARKVATVIDKRNGRQVDDRIRPFAGAVVGSAAERNIAQVLDMRDDEGTPLVSKESVEETVAMLGGKNSALLANPQVIDIVINNAMGLDRRKGRTPKPVEDPVFLDRNMGGRRGSVLTQDDRRIMQRTGLSEKEMTDTMAKLDKAAAAGRGGSIRLE